VQSRRLIYGRTGCGESEKLGMWKTWGVDNTGSTGKHRVSWKTPDLVENTGLVEEPKTKTMFVNKYLPYHWLWTKFRQRRASLPKLRSEKV